MATGCPEPPGPALFRVMGLVLFLSSAMLASGQDGWLVRRFTANDGLPQNTVRSMAFDEHGFLWMTSEGGLLRYDGLNFRTFARATSPVVVEDRMRHLLRSPEGRLYVNDGAQSLYRLEDGRLSLVVDGNAITGSLGSLAGSFPSERLYKGMVTEALRDAVLRKYSGGGSLVIAFDSVRWAVHGHRQIVLHEALRAVRSIPVNALSGRSFHLNGTMYVDDEVRGMLRLDASLGELHTVPLHGRPDGVLIYHWGAQVDDVFALSAAALWRVVPLGDGLAFEQVFSGLSLDAPVLSVAATLDGNTVFMGTANKGLYRFDRQRLSTLHVPQGNLPSESASNYAVLPFSDSTVLVNTGLEVGERVQRMTSMLPVFADRFALHMDPSGRTWAVLADTLVLHHREHDALRSRMVTPVGHVSAFMQAGDTVWVAGERGVLAYVDDRQVLHVPIQLSGPMDRIYSLCKGGGDEVWVATMQGVFSVDARTASHALVEASRGLHVRALHREGDRMFVGTYGQGVHVHQAGAWKQVPFDPRHGCTHVHSFIPDTLGWIWMPTNKGLFRMERNALDRWLAEGTGSVELASYGEEEGAATAEFNGGCSPAHAQLANGMVVLPSMEGLVWFAPQRMPYPWPRGAVHVDRVEVDGKPVDHTAPLPRLTAGAVLAAEVSMVFWGASRNRIWRYRLAGHGPPQLIGPEGRIVVERLPAGAHALEVLLPDGSTRTVLRFVVIPPWYLRWWALLAMAAVLILLGAMVSGMRQRRIMKANLELEARIAQRTADLSRSNEQLGRESRVREQLVRILSHDIVAPLKAIARLGRQGIAAERQWPEQELRAAFSDMAEASDTLHGDASELLEWIKRQGGNVRVSHEHVALHDHVARVVERSREAARQEHVQVVNAVAEELLVCTDPQLLGIVLQNILSNAIRHAPGCRVHIGARETDDGFVLEVADNGPGMSPAALERIRTLLNGEGRDTELRSGLGYMIIADMAALLNARVEVRPIESGGTQVNVYCSEPISSIGQNVQ
jgi:signal transduction histidine kinase